MKREVKIMAIKVKSQAGRRMLVAGLYAGYGVVVGALWLAQAVSVGLVGLAIPGLLLLGICHWSISQAVLEYSVWAPKSVARPDERQARVRDRGFVISYQVLSGVLCLGILYGMVAGDQHWWHPTAGEWKAALFGALLLSATLPSAVIAWLEPDDPQEIGDELVAQQKRA
jgi:hypothetical protein